MGSLKANLIQRMEYMCCTEALVIFVYLTHHTYIDPNHPLTSDMEIKTKYTKINFSRLLRLVVLPLPHLHDSQWSGQGAVLLYLLSFHLISCATYRFLLQSGCLYVLLGCILPCVPVLLLRQEARERYIQRKGKLKYRQHKSYSLKAEVIIGLSPRR